jgi:hypothetical protein
MIIDIIRQPVRKIKNLKNTIRVISPGLLSKFRSANNKAPKYTKTSSCANNIIKIPKENVFEPSYFPVRAIMAVNKNEKTRKVICETGFRRLSTL